MSWSTQVSILVPADVTVIVYSSGNSRSAYQACHYKRGTRYSYYEPGRAARCRDVQSLLGGCRLDVQIREGVHFDCPWELTVMPAAATRHRMARPSAGSLDGGRGGRRWLHMPRLRRLFAPLRSIGRYCSDNAGSALITSVSARIRQRRERDPRSDEQGLG